MSDVLIVEDEPTISRILERRLNAKGFKCSVVEGIEEARQLLQKKRPQILFLDYILKDGRSEELAREGLLEGIEKIFLMSAFMDELDKRVFSKFTPVYLKKPFTDLNSVIDQV